TKTFTSSKITAVVADLKAGGDAFTYKLGGGSDLKFAKNIQAHLGAGDDAAHFDFLNSGSGNATIKAKLPGNGDDNFGGNEVVDIVLGKVADVAVFIKTRLEFGNDTFVGTLKGALDGHASVKFDLVDPASNGLLFKGGNDHYKIDAFNDV